ncbi:MAG: sugar phosphate isomerase/epimerase [Alphaproteobacteria bacterium]|jgi:sugar phosphate isomerase/epimerase|nr:sugar phosphate isomerase/epimerase [Alphaproteobacteria bacterium]MBU0805509.1 sugar phosphate isomerase/epimerase [Alphaproteobacteria bacterium]MBU0873455.1 sugar phosphate isomerase/epimerase [Alphaproteobacteria bacterium]MBU1401317.1 sugar phosphate isomerase/epimerase [Alphaproteobacteria bacterium]MBU1592266.1 sugar phosphate isomerase/epimerase [Alphaproteobacteria bacterium]
MKLGLLTAPFPDQSLGEVADWASSVGFEALEIACWPKSSGASRRYAGTSHIDADGTSASQAKEIAASLSEKGVTVSGLGFYPNPLHPDADHRQAVIDHLKKVIVLASRMGVGVVNTFCGGDASKTVDANWEDALKVWPEVIAHARDNGVKLAFENCPMIFSYDEWPGGHNIAYAPYIWRRILEAWGGDVGMNFDPSHLVLQMIDQDRFIREFGASMLHVHAKDLMIDRDGLYERGILSAGMGWQVPRMPGLGDVDWSGFFAGLYRAGYDGPVIIEHEDRRFEGSDDKVKRGFLLARDVLRPFVK